MSTLFLDITKDHCPMSFVKTKMKLKELNEHDILEVLISEGEQLHSIPWVAEQSGFKVLEIKKQDAHHRVIIQAPEGAEIKSDI